MVYLDQIHVGVFKVFRINDERLVQRKTLNRIFNLFHETVMSISRNNDRKQGNLMTNRIKNETVKFNGKALTSENLMSRIDKVMNIYKCIRGISQTFITKAQVDIRYPEICKAKNI